MKTIIGTALNLTVGSRVFRGIAKNAPGNDGYIILSFDPDEHKDLEAMPGLLDTLKKHKTRASFAAIGAWVEANPKLWKRVRDEGHEIINHTQTHPDNIHLNPRHYHKLTREERKQEILACHETVQRLLGVHMKGFRTPHFGFQHTQDTYGILEELGYVFSTSTLAIETEGKPFMVGNITEFPLSYCPRHPWSIFDSAHAFRGRFCTHTKEQFHKDFETLVTSGVFLNIYLDPQDLHYFSFEHLLRVIKKYQLRTIVYEDLV